MIQMVVFDLDGTLLDSEKNISSPTYETLRKLVRHNIEIVPCTGRPYFGLLDPVRKIPDVHYVITTNGAGIYHRPTDQLLHEEPIPLNRVLPLIQRLEPLQVMSDPFVRGRSYMSEHHVPLIDEMTENEAVKHYIRASRTIVPNLEIFLKELNLDVEKVTLNFVHEADGSRRDFDQVLEILRDFPDLNAISGGMDNIEITASGVTKATGLTWLCKKLQIPLSDVVAFGDSGNDIEMLRAAGLGIAMENGEPEAKKAADVITRSNDNDGFVYGCEKFVF